MEAKELRIGNYVYDVYDHVNRQIDGYDFINTKQHFKPIPLTEEWLLKFGFEKIPHFTVHNGMKLSIGRNRYLSVGDVNNPNQMMFLCSNVKDSNVVEDLVCVHNYDYDGWLNVHQLQNLYFALTGEELTIKQ